MIEKYTVDAKYFDDLVKERDELRAQNAELTLELQKIGRGARRLLEAPNWAVDELEHIINGGAIQEESFEIAELTRGTIEKAEA